MTGRQKSTSVVWLGRIDYPAALDIQMRACRAKQGGLEEDLLLLLEHPPTITMGRNGNWSNLVADDESLQARGIFRYEADRGGDITFHGPGQLVGYPILKLDIGERDVRRYMRNLEESVIRLLAAHGIEGARDEQYTGVWTRSGKIAALGVHISRWITRHGMALNVNTDLTYFDLIVPCGISGRRVTSMRSLLGHALDLEVTARQFALEFASVFDRMTTWITPEMLSQLLAGDFHARVAAEVSHEG